jgi:hypothetical protein
VSLATTFVQPTTRRYRYGGDESWLLRYSLLVFAPLYGLWLLVVGPRRMFTGTDHTLDDLPSPTEEMLREHPFGSLDDLLLDARDRALCEALLALVEEDREQAVGICWGAAHVRAVMSLLKSQLGYRIVDATWVSVCAF